MPRPPTNGSSHCGAAPARKAQGDRASLPDALRQPHPLHPPRSPGGGPLGSRSEGFLWSWGPSPSADSHCAFSLVRVNLAAKHGWRRPCPREEPRRSRKSRNHSFRPPAPRKLLGAERAKRPPAPGRGKAQDAAAGAAPGTGPVATASPRAAKPRVSLTIATPPHRLAPPRSRGLVLQLYVSLVNGSSFRLMSSKACPSPAGLCLCSCGCPQVSGPCAHHFRTGRGRQESVLVPQATEERPRVCLGLLGPARSSAALKCLPAQQGGRSSGSPSPPVQSPDATANQSPRREIPRSCTPGIPGSGVCP